MVNKQDPTLRYMPMHSCALRLQVLPLRITSGTFHAASERSDFFSLGLRNFLLQSVPHFITTFSCIVCTSLVHISYMRRIPKRSLLPQTSAISNVFESKHDLAEEFPFSM